MRLFREDVVRDVYLNDDTRVNVPVEVWMILLDERPVGSGDFLPCCAVVDTQDCIGASGGSRAVDEALGQKSYFTFPVR